MRFNIEDDLWFADGPDEIAERAAQGSLALVAGRVYGVRAFSAAARRLIELTSSNEYRIADIVKTLESDTALSARVLRLANSAAFGLRTPSKSIGHAATMLGARVLSEIATVAAMFETVGLQDPLAIDLRDHAAAVGSIARSLALRGGFSADDVFAAGLLHDLGKMLLLQHEDDEGKEHGYRELLGSTRGQRDRAHVLERGKLGYDHAVLAGHLLRAWNLPEPLPTAVAWHHQPARAFAAGGEVERIVSLVRLSDLIAYEIPRMAEDPDTTEEQSIAIVAADEAAEALGFTEANLAAAWEDLEVAILEARKLFSH